MTGSEREGAGMNVALVNMPFAAADTPSIQCGLLKAEVQEAGHRADVHYLNLELAAELGSALYTGLSHLPKNLLLGEWLFSVAAFGPRPNEAEYRATCPTLDGVCRGLGWSFERLVEMRSESLPRWIGTMAERLLEGGYDVVGFTSMFEQNTAALALAREIKRFAPDVVLVFGGANFDGEMGREYLRTMPFIDLAVSGEGDVALPEILERLAAGESPLGLPGVIGRRNGRVEGDTEARPVTSMDELPDPEYSEYFEALDRLGRDRVLGDKAPLVVIETARGCWWGQKQHCTFCGLNHAGIGFRSRSPAGVAEQLHRMSSRYKVMSFEAVDNIMDYRYLEELWEPLAEAHYDYRFFYEVKSNLKPSQIRTLRRGGVSVVQPGIESLSSGVLGLMRKGVSALQNVRFLKWAHYYGLEVHWNLLTGFPGELPEHYEEQLRLIPRIRHLPPPHGTEGIWLQRFSPYFTDSSFPVREVRPFPVYRHIYPETVDLDRIAYFFECEMGDTLETSRLQPLADAVESWKAAWQNGHRPALIYQRAPDWIQIVDRRTDEIAVHAFGELEAAVYECCAESGKTVRAIQGQLARERGIQASEAEVSAALDGFLEHGLLFEERGSHLALALPANRSW